MTERTPVQPVERRLWWPHVLLDEDMPPGRATPGGWLVRLAQGSNDYCVDDCGASALAEGDIIGFSFCDTLGSALLTFDADGEPIWQPAVPAHVDHLWDGGDIISDSAAEFAEQIKDSIGCGFADDEERTLAMLSRWPGDALRFQFTAIDGPPRFVPLDLIPEPPGEVISAPDDPQTDLFRATSEPTP